MNYHSNEAAAYMVQNLTNMHNFHFYKTYRVSFVHISEVKITEIVYRIHGRSNHYEYH